MNAFPIPPMIVERLGWHTLGRLQRVGVSPVSDEVLATLKRASERLGLRRAVRVLHSTLARVPIVVGYFRPVILLPVSLVTSIPAAQLEGILAHELAHVRRHDFLVNLLQTLVETAFFYHPAVWWLSRRVRAEREHCCDDLVVNALGNRVEYGRALLAIEELRGRGTVLAVGASDGSLLARVRRIVGLQSGTASSSPWPAPSLVVLAIIAVFVMSVLIWHSPAEAYPPAAARPRPAEVPNVKVETETVANLPLVPEFKSATWTNSANQRTDRNAVWFHSGEHVHFVLYYDGFLQTGLASDTYRDTTISPSLWRIRGHINAMKQRAAGDEIQPNDLKAEPRRFDLAFDYRPPNYLLSIDGKELDLAKGRVFVLSNSGEPQQLAIKPLPLSDRNKAGELKERIDEAIRQARTESDAQAKPGLQTVIEKHAAELKSIDLSTDGKLLATTNGGGAKIWETSTGKLLRSFPNDNAGRKHSDPGVSNLYTNHVWSVQLSPDCQQLAIGDVLGVRLWDVQSGALRHQLDAPYRYGMAKLVFSKDGQLLARTGTSGKDKGKVVPIWSTKTGEKLFELHTESDAGAFSDNNNQFAVGMSDWQLPLAVFQLSGVVADATQLPPESTKDKIQAGSHYRGKKAEDFIDNWKPVWGEPQLGIQYGGTLEFEIVEGGHKAAAKSPADNRAAATTGKADSAGKLRSGLVSGQFGGFSQTVQIGLDGSIYFSDAKTICQMTLFDDDRLQVAFENENQILTEVTLPLVTGAGGQRRAIWSGEVDGYTCQATAIPFSTRGCLFRLEKRRDGELVHGSLQFFAVKSRQGNAKQDKPAAPIDYRQWRVDQSGTGVVAGRYTGASQRMQIAADGTISYRDQPHGICHLAVLEDGRLTATFRDARGMTAEVTLPLVTTAAQHRASWSAEIDGNTLRATAIPYSDTVYVFRLEKRRDGKLIEGEEQFYAINQKLRKATLPHTTIHCATGGGFLRPITKRRQ